MKTRIFPALCLAVMSICFLAPLPSTADEPVVLKTYNMDTLDGLISRSDASIDKEVSSDGRGSLKITANGPRVVRLFETGNLDVDNARLIYQARLRTQDVKGRVFLEMWCHFPGKGEFFSRGLQNPLSGTNEWSAEETPFLLQKGEKPDNVKLNVVIDSGGIVWIDDVKLLKAPLK
jgi:hypothetical protein